MHKMKRLFKQLSIFLLVVLTVLSFGSAVQAADDFQVDFIKVNGMTQDLNAVSVLPIYVERDSYITVEVFLHGLDGSDVAYDTKVSAWIGGYEYGDIDDVTPIFQTLPGVQDRKVLTLEIPNDLESSKTYTLNVDIYDDEQREYNEFPLVIEETRHELNIYDATFNPGKVVKAGTPLFVSIRLENLGETEENDVKVTVSIPALGISTVNYLDELNTEFDEENEDHLRNDNSKQMDLLLRIPSDAATGTYDVQVDIEYNRGHSFLTKTLSLNVEGTAQAAGAQTVINSDSSSKVVNAGESVEYKVMMANLGLEPGVYSVTVDGVSAWGEAVVQPSFLTIMPDSTGEVTITVTPYDSVDAASHTWVAKVMLGTDVLSELVFTTKVEVENTVEQSNDTVKSVLTAIFFILLIVLVVLAIVIAFRKVRSDDDEDEETSALEGQTYYQYYPRN